MATKIIKDPKVGLSIIIATFCFVAGIVLFAMGGTFFAKENPKVHNYLSSICTVDARSVRSYRCSTRYYSYTCFGPIWKVHHEEITPIFATVEQDRRYSSVSDAIKKADEYKIGSSYACWYDQRNPTIAQWSKPSIHIAIILLACGGLSTCLVVLFVFLARRFKQQYLLENPQQFVNPYFVQNVYAKT